MEYISEDYCSEELSGMLREKGYIGATNTYLGKDDIKVEQITLQSAMKWLREVHKLHITVVPYPFNFEHQDIQDGWGCEVTHLSDLSYDGNYEFFLKRYPIYEQAAEAAIRYCLENLV